VCSNVSAGITGIHWFCSGSTAGRTPAAIAGAAASDLPGTLCIVFDNGKIQMSRGDDDASSEIFDSGLSSISYCRWATKGNILAIVGTSSMMSGQSSKGESTRGATSVVKFFDGYGKFIRSIRIPGENIAAVSWEGGDLRLSLAVDSFIYFANIRHAYTWAYFLNTVVFTYPRSERSREVCAVIPLSLRLLQLLTSYYRYCCRLTSCSGTWSPWRRTPRA
jgi:WD repeat-containing protein 35